MVIAVMNTFRKSHDSTSIHATLFLGVSLISLGVISPATTFARPPTPLPCEKEISDEQKREYEEIVLNAPEYRVLQGWNVVSKDAGGCFAGAPSDGSEVPVSIHYLAPKELSNFLITYHVSLRVGVSPGGAKITAAYSSRELPTQIQTTIHKLEQNDRVREYINRVGVQYASLENGRAFLSNDDRCPKTPRPARTDCGKWIDFDYDSGYTYLLPSETNYVHFPEINKAVSVLEQNTLPLGCKVTKGEYGYTTTRSGKWVEVRVEGKDCLVKEIGVRIARDGTCTINPYDRTLYTGYVEIEPMSLSEITAKLEEQGCHVYAHKDEATLPDYFARVCRYRETKKNGVEIFPHGLGYGPRSFFVTEDKLWTTKVLPGSPNPDKFKEAVRQDVSAIGNIVQIKENSCKITKTRFPWDVVYDY